ncbi:hypothetical protein P1J78_13235 [Psychromarinibacter sp. C21-152]|uniref:Uncharacterized protein n=1 Tax=Psychromarinibacter sediminicola TaxID=3033385 RepID=A0AAE3T904_9RHOB|nr:hypothetical protein [Psychromarinibacter sediminicola]MDF0601702.1 hypothetical protein [Psychromarinibacter sediminicola]
MPLFLQAPGHRSAERPTAEGVRDGGGAPSLAVTPAIRFLSDRSTCLYPDMRRSFFMFGDERISNPRTMLHLAREGTRDRSLPFKHKESLMLPLADGTPRRHRPAPGKPRKPTDPERP